MKITATKTHWEGTGHLPQSAQRTDHLPATWLPVFPFCKRDITSHVTQTSRP